MPITGFRTRFRALSPSWLQAGVDERIMYGFGLGLDALLSKLTQGVSSRFPTQASAAANALTGADRLMQPGLSEADASFAARLQRAFDSWRFAGSARSILSELLGFLLAKTPAVRTVATRYAADPGRLPFMLATALGAPITAATNASPIAITTATPHGLSGLVFITITGARGNLAANGPHSITVTGPSSFTLNATVGSGAYTSGGRWILTSAIPSLTYPPARVSSQWDSYAAGRDPNAEPTHSLVTTSGGNWDWDSLSQVSGSWGWWGDFVVIESVAPNDWAHPPTWLWDDVTLTWDTIPGCWDLDVEPAVMSSIQGIVAQRKAAQAWIRCIIVSFDATLFDSTQPAGGGVNPDGHFGRWSKVVGGVVVPARFANAAYCDGSV